MNSLLITIFFILSLAAVAYGEDDFRQITPYGDCCPLCGVYGYCKEQPTYKESVKAIKTYYERKGLKAVVIKEDGRFLEAEIYKDKDLVDRVLLDCKTGRIRSIY